MPNKNLHIAEHLKHTNEFNIFQFHYFTELVTHPVGVKI